MIALKCATGLLFREKTVVSIVQSGLKLYDFTIVGSCRCESSNEHKSQSVAVFGSEATDGIW